MLIIGIGNRCFCCSSLRTFLRNNNYNTCCITIGNFKFIIIYLSIFFIFFNKVGTYRQVVPGNLAVLSEDYPLIVLINHITGGSVVGLNTFRILTVYSNLEGLIGINSCLAIFSHLNLLGYRQRTNFLGVLIDEVHLGEAILSKRNTSGILTISCLNTNTFDHHIFK